MKIEINKELYELEYTINSVCDLEELTGKDLGESLAAGGFASLRAMLWCGLVEHKQGLTVRDAGNLLQQYIKAGGTMESLVEKMTKAVEHAGFLGGQAEVAEKPKVKIAK